MTPIISGLCQRNHQKIFETKFKSLAAKIKHVASLGYAALCMHYSLWIVGMYCEFSEDKNKSHASIRKNVDLILIKCLTGHMIKF